MRRFFTFFYGIFLVLTCGLGSNVFANDSTDVVLTKETPLIRAVKNISSQYANQIFTSNPDQIYSPTDLGTTACPPGTVQAQASPPLNYIKTVMYYAPTAVVMCGAVNGPHNVDCTRPTPYPVKSRTPFVTPGPSSPDSVCALASSDSAGCQFTTSYNPCPVGGPCSVNSPGWKPVFFYKLDPTGTFNAAFMCIDHQWGSAPIV